MMKNQYEFYTIEIMSKGDLKGYINGEITFYYNNEKWNHEFLYRFDDVANGENYELVSIDYGYKVPFIKEVWEEIETYLKNYAMTRHNQTIYYWAINPLTNNWCISKTKEIAWTTSNNLIFDTGWLNIIKYQKAIDKYIEEQRKKGIFIKVLQS